MGQRIAKITLAAGVGAVLFWLGLGAYLYVSGLLLWYPPVSLSSYALIGLLLISAALFLLTAPATIASIALRKSEPIWLFAVLVPPLALISLISISATSRPVADWLDRAGKTVVDSVSEQTLLEFAQEVRQGSPQLNPYTLSTDYLVIAEAPLAKLPDAMQSIRFLGQSEAPRASVQESYVILLYGAPRVGWGLLIADALPKEMPPEQAMKGDLYRRIYPNVWIFDTLQGAWEVKDAWKNQTPLPAGTVSPAPKD